MFKGWNFMRPFLYNQHVYVKITLKKKDFQFEDLVKLPILLYNYVFRWDWVVGITSYIMMYDGFPLI